MFSKRRAILAVGILPLVLLTIVAYFLSPWVMESSQFVPRIACGNGWSIQLVQISELSEVIIFLCYMILSVGVAFWHMRVEFKMSWRDVVGSLIWSQFVFACGLTHLTSRLMFAWPAYRLDALVKVYCAIWSIAAVIQLPYLLRMDKYGK